MLLFSLELVPGLHVVFFGEATARQATFNFGDKYCQMKSSDAVKNFQGHQQVVTWIIKGSPPSSSGSSGQYFGRHFGRDV